MLRLFFYQRASTWSGPDSYRYLDVGTRRPSYNKTIESTEKPLVWTMIGTLTLVEEESKLPMALKSERNAPSSRQLLRDGPTLLLTLLSAAIGG